MTASEKWPLARFSADPLGKDDILHYQKIVVAIAETICLMKEIDEVIDEHGGWPGAFQSTSSTDAAATRAGEGAAQASS
jgi:hypothetical protein